MGSSWCILLVGSFMLACVFARRYASSITLAALPTVCSPSRSSRAALRGSELPESAVVGEDPIQYGSKPGPLVPNPGPLPLSGHFSLVLQNTLDRLDRTDVSDASLERHVVHATEDFVTIHDGYPKAAVHLLVLPRKVRVAGLGQLNPDHVPMLRCLAAYVAWLMRSVEGKTGDPGLGWLHGVHSVPSLRQLHVHVMTRDLCSPSMKNAKHFSSFRPPFLVRLDDIIEALEQGADLADRFHLRTAEDEMKRRSLCCHRCGTDFGRKFADLKRHLASCSAPIAPELPPRRWPPAGVAFVSPRGQKREREGESDRRDAAIDLTD